MKTQMETKPQRTSAMILLAISLIAIQLSHAQQTFTLTEGVVVNKTRNEIYLTIPEGKVQAINLTTGQPIWRTAAKTKALNITGGKLIVQAFDTVNAANLVIAEIDPTQDGKLTARKTLTLPSDVRAALNGNFNIKATNLNGETVLKWQYKTITKGIYEGEDSIASQSGTLKINRTTNKLTNISSSLVPQTILTPSIAVPQSEKIKNDNSTQQFLSKDGLYILSSQKTAGDEVFNNYTWQVYERATQKLLGSLSNYNSYRAFTVSNNILVFETGPYTQAGQNVSLQLVGYDLTTGKEIWRSEILDSYFSGQTPP